MPMEADRQELRMCCAWRVSLVRQASLSIILQLVRALVAIASLTVIARVLGPAEVGLIAVAAPLIGLSAILQDFGGSAVIVRAKVIRRNDLAAYQGLSMAMSCAIAVAILLSASSWGRLFPYPGLDGALRWVAPLIVLNGLLIQGRALMLRRGKVVLLSCVEVAAGAFGAAASIFLAFNLKSHMALIWGYYATSIFSLLFFSLLVPVLYLPRNWNGFRFPDWKFQSKYTSSECVGFLSKNHEYYFIAYALGVVQVGIYERSKKLVSFSVENFAGIFSRISMSRLSRAKGTDRLCAVWISLASFYWILLSLPLLVAGLYSKELIVLVMGAKFVSGGPVLQWLLFAAALTPQASGLRWLWLIDGNGDAMLRWQIMALLMNLIAVILALPYGLEAVALGLAAAALIRGVMVAVVLRKRLGPANEAALFSMISIILPLVLAIASTASGVAAAFEKMMQLAAIIGCAAIIIRLLRSGLVRSQSGLA